jgi:hypothetical protein
MTIMPPMTAKPTRPAILMFELSKADMAPEAGADEAAPLAREVAADATEPAPLDTPAIAEDAADRAEEAALEGKRHEIRNDGLA